MVLHYALRFRILPFSIFFLIFFLLNLNHYLAITRHITGIQLKKFYYTLLVFNFKNSITHFLRPHTRSSKCKVVLTRNVDCKGIDSLKCFASGVIDSQSLRFAIPRVLTVFTVKYDRRL